MTKEPPPEGLVNDVDRACNLILECMEFNNISKSAAVSAMATMIVTILAQIEDSKNFYGVIKLMEAGFKQSRTPLP